MKTIKKQFKSITLLLIMIILLQSCVAYKGQSVTLERALNSKNKVKIETKDNLTFKYDSVTFEGEKYYGNNKVDGKILKTELKKDVITNIRLEDKKKSKFLNVMIPVSIIGVAFGYIIISKASDINLHPGFGN
jgi:hypothetical protein